MRQAFLNRITSATYGTVRPLFLEETLRASCPVLNAASWPAMIQKDASRLVYLLLLSFLLAGVTAGDVCSPYRYIRVAAYLIFYTVESLFLEHPHDTDVKVSEIANFKCQVSNSSYEMIWIVNGTDAEFGIFRERGVSFFTVNGTMSYLRIIGYISNNNTVVQCAALLYKNHRLIDYEPSTEATLSISLWTPTKFYSDGGIHTNTQTVTTSMPLVSVTSLNLNPSNSPSG